MVKFRVWQKPGMGKMLSWSASLWAELVLEWAEMSPGDLIKIVGLLMSPTGIFCVVNFENPSHLHPEIILNTSQTRTNKS